MNLKIKSNLKIILIFCFAFVSSCAFATIEAPNESLATPKIKQIWEFKNNAFNNTSTIGEDGTIYFVANENHATLYAVSPDGVEKWHAILPYQAYTVPCIDTKGFIYIFGRDSSLYSFYPDGRIKWQISIPHANSDSANVFIPLTVGTWSQRVYVTTMRGNIFAVNHDGTISWKYLPEKNSNINTPVIEFGDKKNPIIYFVLNRDFLKSSEYTEIHQYKQMTDHIIMQRPANIYYFAISHTGKIYFVSRKNYSTTIEVLEPSGKSLWSARSDGSSVIAYLDKDSTLYYVGIENHKNFLAARNAEGKLLWINNYPNWVYDLLLSNDKLTVVSNTSFNPARQKIFNFDKKNGQLACESDEFNFLFAYPNVKNKNIYLSTNIGLTALEICV